ncbi:uncharacterized protein [Ptychodera flava]|uniref:uncharacterized protein n=1 Tax=Ptychodera flava TaxID=63121 RepID=UPI00396A565A
MTDTVLTDIGALYLKLRTTIDPEEYRQCKEELSLPAGYKYLYSRRHSVPDVSRASLFTEIEDLMSADPLDDLAVIRPPYKKKTKLPLIGPCTMLIGKPCFDATVNTTEEDASALRRENRLLKSRVNILERKIVYLEKQNLQMTEGQTSMIQEVAAITASQDTSARASTPECEDKAVSVVETEENEPGSQGDGNEDETLSLEATEESEAGSQGEREGIEHLSNTSWSRPWMLRFSPGLALNHVNSLIVVSRDENRLVTDPWDEREGRQIFTFDEVQRPTIPWDVAVSPGGNHYVTDIANRRVVVCDKENKVINTFGQNEDINPRGITFTLDGSVILTDFNGDFLRKYSSDGEHKAGQSLEGPGQSQDSSQNHTHWL